MSRPLLHPIIPSHHSLSHSPTQIPLISDHIRTIIYLLSPKGHHFGTLTAPGLTHILFTVRNAKKNSAPGFDGIPYALYKRVSIFQALLVKVIQAAFRFGSYLPSWCLTFMRSILKPGKDRLLFFYKIFSSSSLQEDSS